MMRTVGKVLAAAIVVAVTFPYAAAPLYDIVPPRPFRSALATAQAQIAQERSDDSTAWYNPYATAAGTWSKVNVHLHSRAWFGATDGRKNSLNAIDSVYRQLGYEALALSNYQRIDSLGNGWKHLPCYEHGYNIQKTHQLVLGARSVVWLDCVLPQTVFVKQWILDVLRPTAEVLIAAHPAFGRPSYSEHDMTLLSGYDCIEVFNHYRTSLAHWDSALSNGILVWGVGNDDCHDVSSDGETGVCLTLIALPPNWTPADLYHAYRNGHTIAVRTQHAELPIGVPQQSIIGDSLVVHLGAPADSIRFISGGNVIARFGRRARAALWLPRVADYVRVEVYATPAVYALNPAVQLPGGNYHKRPRLQENLPLTVIHRAIWMLLYAHLLLYLRRNR
ncbi:MAG: hypothetical protein KatS3mg040_0962 [Candidatus Kapaibacterium sp.]|nr:MAG: hypothetical protein KatS3mg040_0962 [Candidatus Kapabacteria bacterium]